MTIARHRSLPAGILAACFSLLAPVVSADSATSVANVPSVASFDPIAIQAIYPPLKPHGSADEALESGHVSIMAYPMAKSASKPWRIAFLFPHLKDPYWVGCSYGVITEAKRLGVAVDILPAEGYDDLVGQLRRMDEAIAAHYDAIVISPLSQTANNPSIAKAKAAGIPVFELANDSTSDDLTTKITTSLKGMGVTATLWAVHDAQARGLKSVNIALLPGPADAGWVQGEVEGTREVAQRAPIKVNILDIKYGDSDRIGQTQLTAALLAKYGSQIDYVLGCTGCAPAAILPIHEAGLSDKIRIVAYDLTREIAADIKNGDIKASADTKGVSQARVAIDAVVNHLEGRDKVTAHTMLIQLGLVDRHNYRGYRFDTSTAPEGFTPVLSYRPAPKP